MLLSYHVNLYLFQPTTCNSDSFLGSTTGNLGYVLSLQILSFLIVDRRTISSICSPMLTMCFTELPQKEVEIQIVINNMEDLGKYRVHVHVFVSLVNIHILLWAFRWLKVYYKKFFFEFNEEIIMVGA